MKWGVLIVILLGCKTTRTTIIQGEMLEATNPPLTNLQQTAHIYALEAEVAKLKLQIDSLKNSTVFLDSSFFIINETGTFTFKSNIVFDTITVKNRLNVGIRDTTQKVIIGL